MIETAPLFAGLAAEDARRVAGTLGVYVRKYGRNEALIWQGERVVAVGMALSGRFVSSRSDAEGNRVTVSVIRPGGYIGVMLAGRGEISPVDVIAEDDGAVVFVSVAAIIDHAGDTPEHRVIVRNFLAAVADKAIELYGRVAILSAPTIRAKILELLAREAVGEWFRLPLNRSQMAEYLACDRSALSRELSRMKSEGIIDFDGDMFKILTVSPQRR